MKLITWVIETHIYFSTYQIKNNVSGQKIAQNKFPCNISAFPEHRMVLNAICLKQEFVGWMSKLGLNFMGFMNSMHKIGKNTIFMTLLLRANSIQTVQAGVFNAPALLGKAYSQIIGLLPQIKSTLQEWNLDKS